MEPLDDSTLDEIARLVCGDDGPVYRKGWEIPGLMKRAGWARVPEYEGVARRQWVLEQLHRRQATNQQGNDDITRLILRLADPREYRGEPHALAETVEEINVIGALEGWQVHIRSGRPQLVECEPTMSLPSGFAPVELKVSMGDVVSDPVFASVLQRRLDEARICAEQGAHVAAIVMLGSLLEGVLLQAAMTRSMVPPSKDFSRMGLADLIQLAHNEGWIAVDAQRFAGPVRVLRNLVHPYAQVRDNLTPDQDTVDMCWPVVNATLNDLAASKPDE